MDNNITVMFFSVEWRYWIYDSATESNVVLWITIPVESLSGHGKKVLFKENFPNNGTVYAFICCPPDEDMSWAKL